MQRFTETAIIDPLFPKKVEVDSNLREKINSALSHNKLTEAVGGSFTAWEVPISAYDVDNANGRNYPKALWERVINEQKNIWEGSPMLADHPSGDGDGTPSNIAGVWIGARLGEDGFVYGTVVPSGRLGEDLQDHLAKGLKAGTSSSGFGELLSDKKTVDPSTYLIERLSDWVLTPSQGTYFKYDSAKQETKNASDSNRLGESANKPESVVKEKTTVSKVTKLEEKRIRKDIELFLESAATLDNPQDRLVEFQDILESLEEGVCPDLRERAMNKIAEEKTAITNILQETIALKETLKVENLSDINKKLEEAAAESNDLIETAKDWKAIAKSIQSKLDKTRESLEAAPTGAYVTHLKNRISKIYIENASLKKQLEMTKVSLAEASLKRTAVNSKVNEEFASIKESMTNKAKEIAKLKGIVERLQTRAVESEAREKELAESFRSYKKSAEAIPTFDNPQKRVQGSINFQETSQLEAYYNDLYNRHGEEIRAYESRIKACKTVREAVSVYMKALPYLNESNEYNLARIPESIAIDMDDRAALLKRAGANIQTEQLTNRMPEGWV